MAATASHLLSRLVRVIAGEIQLLAARRGQPVILTPEDFDAITKQVSDLDLLLGRVGLVDARALALELGVARDWVYANAGRLGGVRLGEGPRARLRFDVERAREALSESAPGVTVSADRPEPRRRGRPRRQALSGVKLIQGRAAPRS
jgi:hypothetical protein